MRDALPRRILDSVTHVKETPSELKKAGGLVTDLSGWGCILWTFIENSVTRT